MSKTPDVHESKSMRPLKINPVWIIPHKAQDVPSPHLDICLYGEEQVCEQSLVHQGPLELGNSEHS